MYRKTDEGIMTVDEIRRPKGDFRSHRALDNILPGFQHDRPTV